MNEYFDLRFMGGAEREYKCDFTMLKKEGFEYKYDLKKILDDTMESGRRLQQSMVHPI